MVCIDKNFPKPFLKWAGGKTQLLNQIKNYLPSDICEKNKYFEPFVGGGAVFFSLSKYFNFECCYLGDSNQDLMLTYYIIQNKPDDLKIELMNLNKRYCAETDRKTMYYEKRNRFNEIHGLNFDGGSDLHVEVAALMIFLNKTCFNGLYRVNRNNEFNVPFANPKKPLIYDEYNIDSVHKALENVKLFAGDYSNSLDAVDENSFVYLDPPYRPINGKKSFEGYSKFGFDDNNQEELADFCHDILNKHHAKFLLSNSNPKNFDENDDYFVNLYNTQRDFNMVEIEAKRCINSNANKRGPVSELLVYNYDVPLNKICTFI